MTQIITRIILAALLLAGLSPAIAQQFPTVPDTSVIGRLGSGTGSGPSQAIPFSILKPQLGINRIALLGDTTYYVRSGTGNDGACTGLVNVDDPGVGKLPRACAFATPQKAIDNLFRAVDLNGHSATIDLTGNFTTGIACAGYFVGGGSATVLGSGSVIIKSTAGATITTTNANAITASAGCKLVITGANITLATVTSGICLVAYDGGTIAFGGLTFAASATGHIQSGFLASQSGGNLVAGRGTVYVTGNYTVTGGAGFHWHVPVSGSALVGATGVTATFVGTPAFSNFTIGITAGLVYAPGFIFSGAVTGPRFLIHHAGTMSGVATVPGSIAGTLSSTGTLAVDDTEGDSYVGIGNIVGWLNIPPSTPAVGNVNAWFDSTYFRFHDKDSSGVVGTTVVGDAGATNNFLTAINPNTGAVSKAQPAIANISGWGTGVAAALGTNVGTAGAPVVNGGSLGTPSGGVLTNTTGLPLTSGVTGTLPVANGGTGVTSGAAEQARLGMPLLMASVSSVNFNSANSDNALAITLPSGYTRIIPFRLNIDHASGTLSTSTFGVFSAAAGGGFAIQAAGTANTITTASDATNNNAMSINVTQSISFVASSLATPNTVYFRVGTAQGSAATADVTFTYFAMP